MKLFHSATNTRTFKAGDVIFRKGETGSEMYAVQQGTVRLLVGEEVVDDVGPDGFFGEMGLIDGRPRSATAVAITDCTLATIDEKRFLFMVQQTPFFAIQVMREIVRRLRRMDERL